MNNRLLRDAHRMALETFDRHPEKGNGRFLHWSFIVQDNAIVGMGQNLAHPVPLHFGYDAQLSNLDYRSKTHSEVKAFFKCRGILNFERRWDIINLRLHHSNRKTKMSAPCPCCTNFMTVMGCKSVIFSMDNDAWGKLIVNK
jgi:hypothetical protein